MIETLRAYRATLGNLDERPKKVPTPKVDLTGVTSTDDLLSAIGLGGPLGGSDK